MWTMDTGKGMVGYGEETASFTFDCRMNDVVDADLMVIGRW